LRAADSLVGCLDGIGGGVPTSGVYSEYRQALRSVHPVSRNLQTSQAASEQERWCVSCAVLSIQMQIQYVVPGRAVSPCRRVASGTWPKKKLEIGGDRQKRVLRELPYSWGCVPRRKWTQSRRPKLGRQSAGTTSDSQWDTMRASIQPGSTARPARLHAHKTKVCKVCMFQTSNPRSIRTVAHSFINDFLQGNKRARHQEYQSSQEPTAPRPCA
jgi:hypothetical protein